MIRYRVFCLERNYEDAAAFPDKMERDAFDNRAAHFLLRESETGQWVAAMRLIVGRTPFLPISKLCLLESHAGAAPDEMTAEVSRLCVLGSFRRRRQESGVPHVVPWTGETDSGLEDQGVLRLDRRREPEILLRLIHAAAQYGKRNNMRYYYALMAESLLRILTRIDLRVVTIGEAYEHRGLRVPCLIDLNSLFLDGPASRRAQDIFHRSSAYLRYSEWKRSLESTEAPEREAAVKSG